MKWEMGGAEMGIMIMVESSVSYRNLRTGYSGNENVKRNDNKDGGSKRSLPYRNLTTSHSGNENVKRNDNEDGGIKRTVPESNNESQWE